MTAPLDRQAWATDLLTRMGYPVTDNNVTSVLAWQYQEGGHTNGATWNPLNSTLGHATYGSMNHVGVATYPDYETGMRETIRTLDLHYYEQIRRDLQSSADPTRTASDIQASPWGTWHGGASTTGALNRARHTVQAHPVTPPVTRPVTHPVTQPAAPHAAAPTPTSTPTSAPAAGAFEGADVDGLDRLAQEFNQAAQIVNEVKLACEVIVAAASIFGPFGAAFVAYLKGVVIPWLTRIAEALQAMAKVLSVHSQAQKDASSSATSLPSYRSPGNLPTGNTAHYPVLTITAVGPSATPVTATPSGNPLEQVRPVIEVADLAAKSADAATLRATPQVLTAPLAEAGEAIDATGHLLPGAIQRAMPVIGVVSMASDADAADSAFARQDYATGVDKLGSATIAAAGVTGLVSAPVAATAGFSWAAGTEIGHGVNEAMAGTTFGDHYQADMQSYYRSIDTFGPAVAVPAGVAVTPIELLRAGGQTLGLLPPADAEPEPGAGTRH